MTSSKCCGGGNKDDSVPLDPQFLEGAWMYTAHRKTYRYEAGAYRPVVQSDLRLISSSGPTGGGLQNPTSADSSSVFSGVTVISPPAGILPNPCHLYVEKCFRIDEGLSIGTGGVPSARLSGLINRLRNQFAKWSLLTCPCRELAKSGGTGAKKKSCGISIAFKLQGGANCTRIAFYNGGLPNPHLRRDSLLRAMGATAAEQANATAGNLLHGFLPGSSNLILSTEPSASGLAADWTHEIGHTLGAETSDDPTCKKQFKDGHTGSGIMASPPTQSTPDEFAQCCIIKAWKKKFPKFCPVLLCCPSFIPGGGEYEVPQPGGTPAYNGPGGGTTPPYKPEIGGVTQNSDTILGDKIPQRVKGPGANYYLPAIVSGVNRLVRVNRQ